MYRLLNSTCVFLFVSGLIWTAAAQTAPVTSSGPVVVTSGMVGIAEGQAAQLNVLDAGVPASTSAAASAVPACVALLSFLDGQGNVLKSATIMVAPGASQSIRLDADTDLNLTVDTRREIRAEVQVPAVPPPSAAVTTPACKLIPSLEILDRITGRTQVVIGVGHVAPGSSN